MDDDPLARLAADPHAAADALARIAIERPDLRVAVVRNLHSSPALLTWLREQGDPAVVAAVDERLGSSWSPTPSVPLPTPPLPPETVPDERAVAGLGEGSGSPVPAGTFVGGAPAAASWTGEGRHRRVGRWVAGGLVVLGLVVVVALMVTR